MQELKQNTLNFKNKTKHPASNNTPKILVLLRHYFPPREVNMSSRP